MEQQLELIRDQQRASWNKFSPGWKKWDQLFMDFLKPMGDEIIQQINPEKDDMVLDVASGTGEPGLTIASLIKNGNVVITDLAEDMLKVARENVEAKGLKNVNTVVCDVSDMPFENNFFDAVSCRFGFMFFPDMLVAAREMYRVLKTGGVLATSVWNVPAKNFWITAMMKTINKYMQVPAQPPGSPGMFRCANHDLMKDILRVAGFKNVLVTEVTSTLNCGTATVYWDAMTEVAAPVVAALSHAEDHLREKIKKEVHQLINDTYPLPPIQIDASALVIYGEK
jgi:ubiquinone/menaquinone biosynthesis C-methylase UbiE